MMKKYLIASVAILINVVAFAQISSAPATPVEKKPTWYEKISIRGYSQVRYNRLFESNPKLKCEQCDRSLGENGGFFLRRVRVIIFGQISERAYYYIQPDFASSASTTGLHFGQLRDMYFDIGVDKNNEYRFRIGQSKVPYGFENMQSSQNRLPLDRNDALNSSVPNERDLGVFFYWAPKSKRHLFSSVIKEGLKGSGDYGIFGIGIYNGQAANRPEVNDDLHVVARLTYPIEWKGQIIEPSLQAYTGDYKIGTDQLSTGVKVRKDLTYIDQRVAASLVLYPKPFGIQAEYNIGKSPEFNKANDSIEVQNLKGGYVTLSYKTNYKSQLFYPFLRYQYFDGGKKLERDARSYNVEELEIGLEWQPIPSFELTAMYTISNRRFEDFTLKNNSQKGNLLRLQAQVNF
ncbi:MAG: porin [Saprospiraceae bacterium]|nr:porin [Saprospiraceae bacterium]